MLKKFIATATVVVCAGGYALAQAQRATFILTDGEKKSGTVVSHGDNHENLINGYLNLGQQGAKDLTFPKSQVAVIDFTGSQPSQAELQALPASGTDMIALRSGDHQNGTLVNLVNGDTVIWKNEAGQTQQYAINDVSKIYLNPDSARTAYNYNASANQAVATSGQTAGGATVQVQANTQWTPTGVMVKTGDHVTFTTTGQIQIQSNGSQVGPDGTPGIQGGALPVPQMAVGGLIAKVANSKPFPIGSNAQPIRMPTTGQLMLGVNDGQLNDNSGAFTVTVKKVG
jgi:hypothetical protein